MEYVDGLTINLYLWDWNYP